MVYGQWGLWLIAGGGAFISFIAIMLGVGGLSARTPRKLTAILGVVTALLTMCLFFTLTVLVSR